MCLAPDGDAVRVRGRLEPRGPAAAVLLTDEQVAALGGGRTPAVDVEVAGHGSFTGRVGRMGGEVLLGFNRQVREQLGVAAGDELEVVLRLRTAPPEVHVPAELRAVLDGDAEAAAAFERLAPSHRKEYARWVGEAKQQATRDRRAAEALPPIREGRPRR